MIVMLRVHIGANYVTIDYLLRGEMEKEIDILISSFVVIDIGRGNMAYIILG
jgi:hypothetical protein